MSEFKLEGSKLTCSFEGKIGSPECEELEIKLNKSLAAKPENIVFNLGEVTFISSAFLRMVLTTAKSVEKGNFSIANVKPDIKKIFKISGLDKVFGV